MNDYLHRKYWIISTLLCCVLLQTTATFSQADLKVDVSDWKLIKALDGSASVFAPQTMETRIDSIETDIGQVVTIHHVLKQSSEYSPNFVFLLSYTIYPEGVIHQDSIAIIQDLLNTTIDNAVLMQNAELLYSSDKAYKDYPGMIWKTKYSDGAYVMKSEIYYANDHLYMLQVGSVANVPTGGAVDHFFDSFKIENFAFRKE